jgi:hypothetical protein
VDGDFQVDVTVVDQWHSPADDASVLWPSWVHHCALSVLCLDGDSPLTDLQKMPTPSPTLSASMDTPLLAPDLATRWQSTSGSAAFGAHANHRVNGGVDYSAPSPAIHARRIRRPPTSKSLLAPLAVAPTNVSSSSTRPTHHLPAPFRHSQFLAAIADLLRIISSEDHLMATSGAIALSDAVAVKKVYSPVTRTAASLLSAPRPSLARAAVIPVLGRTHPMRILLCEDNSINVRMMKMLLRRLGYPSITVAEDGVQALALLEAREHEADPNNFIQCVLMDLSMPSVSQSCATTIPTVHSC